MTRKISIVSALLIIFISALLIIFISIENDSQEEKTEEEKDVMYGEDHFTSGISEDPNPELNQPQEGQAQLADSFLEEKLKETKIQSLEKIIQIREKQKFEIGKPLIEKIELMEKTPEIKGCYAEYEYVLLEHNLDLNILRHNKLINSNLEKLNSATTLSEIMSLERLIIEKMIEHFTFEREKLNAILAPCEIIPISLSTNHENNLYTRDPVKIFANSVLSKPDYLQKFNEGYTEVCLQVAVEPIKEDSKLVWTCLLTVEDWNLLPATDYYFKMESNDFCVYRTFAVDEFRNGHPFFGFWEDSKIHTDVCHTYMELDWENHHWNFTKITIPNLNNTEFYYGIYSD